MIGLVETACRFAWTFSIPAARSSRKAFQSGADAGLSRN
jgi:hypothetical protein